MSGVTKKLISASGGVAGGGFTAIEDVFSTYLYTGNGSTQTITNYIDLAGEGGLVWAKSRGAANSHILTDTVRGAANTLITNSTVEQNAAESNSLSSFNSNGFSLNASARINALNDPTVSWTFRKAPRFFDVVTYTGNGVAGRTVSHNLGAEPGSIFVKRTDASSDWFVYHRSLGNTGIIFLNADFGNLGPGTTWNSTSPTTTGFTVHGPSNDANINGATYVAYLFAHDPLGPSGDGSDGLIDCGSYTGNGTSQEIDLGWEPQWVMVKSASTGGSFYDWYMFDNMRGMNHSTGNNELAANVSRAEGDVFGTDAQIMSPTPRGFLAQSNQIAANRSGETYIYIAIRRGPMRAPESGTEVFAIDTQSQSSAPFAISNFPVDLGIRKRTTGSSSDLFTRMLGATLLTANTTNAEAADNVAQFDYNNGYLDNTAQDSTRYNWMFRRAPEFFDVVAYTGTGTNNAEVINQSIKHNLNVTPELLIIRHRNNAGFDWEVFTSPPLGDDFLRLNKTNGVIDAASEYVSMSESDFVIKKSFPSMSRTGFNYIAYLFATLAGVSKVGSYTGNGSSQTINCGFTTGARFILIKRTDSTGDWYVWDTARGIVAGNDPFLELNTSDAEVTSDDSIDPDSSGFIVNQTATTNVNVSSASYIFYAVA